MSVREVPDISFEPGESDIPTHLPTHFDLTNHRREISRTERQRSTIHRVASL